MPPWRSWDGSKEDLLDARADTFFAAYYMAEPVTVPVSSEIMRLKHFEFLRRKDVIPILRLNDLRLRNRGGRWT